ncbi:AMP-dependent synthetase/ligase [Halegenticoccus tardaugens]|uniref:AMP-dependent synthetase/ligase n=1 Tax=Halegenticoccus tardaugens TaxID=2071624 RepID=UPI00100B2008|nr:long-chain fatty acid--CoA ligase [Halegenticoccus tardaugens]
MDPRDAEAAYESEVLGRTTLPAAFEASAERNANRIAQRYKGGVYDRSIAPSVVPRAPDGDYADLSYAELRGIVRSLAAGFRDLGLDAGDRVGILANTRMEWAQCDLAVLAAGGVVTTVYTSSSERQVRYLLSDAGASGVVVENAESLRRVLAVEDDLDLDFVVVMDDVADGSDVAGALCDRDDVLSLADLHARGEAAFDEAAHESWLAARDPDDLASLVYTSGTTGRPKGVRLSHWNFKSNVDGCYRRFGPRRKRGDAPAIGPRATTLSFLPLAHVFERLAGHFLMFAAGSTVAYAESPDTLREDFRLVRPTVATSVPRVYEKLYDAIREQASESPAKERIFEWAVGVGRAYHEEPSPGPLLSAKHRLADRLVFSQVREALGGRIDFLISGGGSLSPELCALYHGMGVPVLEGYGLTETAPVVSANPPDAPKVGTIGPPLVDVEVAVDEAVVGDGVEAADGRVGELLVRGPNVTDGYWNRPEETAAAFVDEIPADGLRGVGSVADGSTADDSTEAARRSRDRSGRWFRTGDVVELRSDGYLEFRERAKQLVVLSTGKNVAPAPIEGSFAANPLVEQCMVLGDGRKFVSALLVPNVDAVREWAAREGIDLPDDPAALCRDERVRERIGREVDRVNESFEPHERIKRFRLLPEPFSEENGLLTPTMKVKRRHVLDRYADEVDVLYRGRTQENR